MLHKILTPTFFYLKTHIFYVGWASSDTLELVTTMCNVVLEKKRFLRPDFSHGHNYFLHRPITKFPSDFEAHAQPKSGKKYKKNNIAR